MSSRGFTLIELLMVIGVVAVLVSLALPSIGRTVDRSRLVADGARLRENAILVKSYTHDNRGLYPLADSNAFLASAQWYTPLVKGGSLSSPSDADPYLVRPGYEMRFWLSLAMVYDSEKMVPGRTVDPSLADSTFVRDSDIVYPSLKGEMLRYRSGLPAWEGGVVFCCGPRWITPVSMVDLSIRLGTYMDFPGAGGPIAPVDQIGAPVFSTWYGFRGRDL